MDKYKTQHIVNIFGISSTTVRKYADMYEKYLSVDGQRQDGQHRSFNQDDLRVFTTVVTLRAEGKDWDEIGTFLDSGDRFEPPEIDDNALAIMTKAGDDILEMLQKMQDEINELRETKDSHLIAENEKLAKEVKEKEAEIRRLYREIGRLEGKYGDHEDNE